MPPRAGEGITIEHGGLSRFITQTPCAVSIITSRYAAPQYFELFLDEAEKEGTENF